MKHALVTGANQGIGWEVARQLARLGYFVHLGCRNPEAGQLAVERLRADGLDQTDLVVLDVTDDALVQRAAAELGGRNPCLDALVNNAGILGRRSEPGQGIPLDVIQAVFDTNYFGTIRVTRAFLPLLHRSAAPRIVNVTSGLGSLTLHGDPQWKYYRFKNQAYVPSKTALNAYTVMLAYELKDLPFKVNAVDPGYTATGFNGYTGERKPEDAAITVVRYTTLPADGPTGRFLSEEGELPW